MVGVQSTSYSGGIAIAEKIVTCPLYSLECYNAMSVVVTTVVPQPNEFKVVMITVYSVEPMAPIRLVVAG